MSVFSDDLFARVVHAEPVWELLRDAPELAERLPPQALAAARSLAGGGIPVLRDVGPVNEPPYARPPGHRRAFYLRQADGVLAIKGTEPLALNFASFVTEMRAARVHAELRLGSPARDTTVVRSELSALDKFPIVEGKVPGCVTLREALADARAAAAVQRAYLARYGETARLPVPILVARWPDAVADEALAELRPHLRGRALDVVELGAGAGLGVYVYAYPTIPWRLAQLGVPDARGGADVRPRLAAIARTFDPRLVLERWIGLTARLLALGFVSADPLCFVTGDTLQVQNVVLDGGLADVESLVEAAKLDDRALRGAVRRTVHELAVTATRLLLGLGATGVDLRERLPDLHATVHTALAAALRAIEPRDERVAALLLGAGAYERLVDLLVDTF